MMAEVHWPAEEILKKLDILDERQDKMHQTLTVISTVLLGVPDSENGGLVSSVKYLRKDHESLKQRFWILVVALAASGVLGASILGALK